MHLKVYLSLSVHWWQNKHLHIIIGFFLPSLKKNGFYRFHVKIMSVKKQSSKNPSFFLSISHWHKQLKSPLFSIFQNISYAFLFSFFYTDPHYFSAPNYSPLSTSTSLCVCEFVTARFLTLSDSFHGLQLVKRFYLSPHPLFCQTPPPPPPPSFSALECDR